MVEAVAQGTRVRSNGRIVLAKGTPTGTADFGSGLRPTVGVSWGDVSTAWHSTAIPNVEVFFEADRNMRVAAAMPAFVEAALGTGLAQRVFKARSTNGCRQGRRPNSGREDAPLSLRRHGTRQAGPRSAG